MSINKFNEINAVLDETLSVCNDINTNTANLIKYDSNDNVGIGTTTPTNKLQVVASEDENEAIAQFDGAATGNKGNFISVKNSTGNTTAVFGCCPDNVELGGIGMCNSSSTGDHNINFYKQDPALTKLATISGDGNLELNENTIIKFADNGVIESFDQNHRISFQRENNILDIREFGKTRFINGDVLPKLTIEQSGKVLIGYDLGTANFEAQGTLHIFEAPGNAGSATSGSILLEHGDAGGSSSIVFKSENNKDSDYGYVKYCDDCGPQGTGTGERSQLIIGVENDPSLTTQDSVKIASPSPERYLFVNNFGCSFGDDNTFFGWNLYYDGSWRSLEGGWSALNKLDSSGNWFVEMTEQTYAKNNTLSFYRPFTLNYNGFHSIHCPSQGEGQIWLGFEDGNPQGKAPRKIILSASNVSGGGSSDAAIYFVLDGVFKSWGGISSDSRIKQNQEEYPTEESLNIVRNIKVKKYYNTEMKKEVRGFIAQEAKQYVPEAVELHDLTEFGKEEDFHMLDYRRVLLHSFGAIQELEKIINNQNSIINDLKSRIEVLENNP